MSKKRIEWKIYKWLDYPPFGCWEKGRKSKGKMANCLCFSSIHFLGKPTEEEKTIVKWKVIKLPSGGFRALGRKICYLYENGCLSHISQHPIRRGIRRKKNGENPNLHREGEEKSERSELPLKKKLRHWKGAQSWKWWLKQMGEIDEIEENDGGDDAMEVP